MISDPRLASALARLEAARASGNPDLILACEDLYALTVETILLRRKCEQAIWIAESNRLGGQS